MHISQKYKDAIIISSLWDYAMYYISEQIDFRSLLCIIPVVLFCSSRSLLNIRAFRVFRG